MIEDTPGPVVEEVDDTGRGTGVEREDDAPDEIIADPFDPEKIEVATRSMTVNLVLSRLEGKAINLAPDFQRKAGVWNDVRQSRLIESILLRIPLPSFYAAEDADEDWEIVDGIQRLTAIARFVNPTVVDEPRLVLSNLEYLKTFDGQTYDALPRKLQRRIQETEFVFHVIKHGTPSKVKFNIFTRINTGGMPLTYQELRHAMVPGNARRVLFDWTRLSEFQQAVDHSVRPDRMLDREMILRFLAFRLTPYEDYTEGDLNSFLLRTMEAVNDLDDATIEGHRQAFVAAMHTAREVFGREAFRKRVRPDAARSPVNKALFEAVSVALSNLSNGQRARLEHHADKVREGMSSLMQDGAFINAVSVSTGSRRRVETRFRAIEDLFAACIA